MNTKWTVSVFILTFAIGGFFLGKYTNQTKVDFRVPSSEVAKGSSSSSFISSNLNLLKTINNIDEVKPIVTKIINELESNSKDQNLDNQKEVQSIIAGLKLYIESQGILNRAQPILENNLLSSFASISSLKAIKQNIPTHTKHLHALYDYLWLPTENGKKYTSVNQLQSETRAKLIPKLVSIHSQLELDLQNYPAEKSPVRLFDIDVESMLGITAKFLPESYKVYTITSAHLWAVKVEIEKAIASAHYLTAYNFDKLGDLTSSTSFKATGLILSNKLNRKVKLSKTNKIGHHLIHKRLKKKKFRDLLTLKPFDRNQEHPLTSSKSWLIKSLNTQKQATMSAKQVNINNNMINVNDVFIQKYANKHISLTDEELSNLTANTEVVFISPLNGKTFKINPSVIFDYNNPKIQDLKSFFPNGHDLNEYKKSGESKLINLDYGKASSWQDPTFSGIIPGTDNSTLRERTFSLAIHPATFTISSWLRLFQ